MRFLFSPYGRATRLGFWIFFGIYLAAIFISVEADRALGFYSSKFDVGALEALVGLFLFWPSIAVSVRRFHDLGMSGWWVLWFMLISVAAMVIVIILGLFGIPVEIDVEALAAIDGNTSILDMPGYFWFLMVAVTLPYLIQLFMLAFLPGKEGENRFDLNRRNEGPDEKSEIPPWAV